MENQKGISCDKIILEFNAHTKEFIPILNKYLSNILVKFTNELSQTSTFQYKYEEYCNNLKRDIINTLSTKEIEQIFKNLPVEIKRKMLQNFSSQYFFKYYEESNILTKQLIKSEK